jgi:hypothetical protein
VQHTEDPASSRCSPTRPGRLTTIRTFLHRLFPSQVPLQQLTTHTINAPRCHDSLTTGVKIELTFSCTSPAVRRPQWANPSDEITYASRHCGRTRERGRSRPSRSWHENAARSRLRAAVSNKGTTGRVSCEFLKKPKLTGSWAR